MLDPSMIESESVSGSPSGFTYSAQYGVRRASMRPDAYRTQFGSITADEYLTPMIAAQAKPDLNVARRLSRNSFLIPPQTFVRRATDGEFLFFDLFCYRFWFSSNDDNCFSSLSRSDSKMSK